MTQTSREKQAPSPYDDVLKRDHIEARYEGFLADYVRARDALFDASSPSEALVADYLRATRDVLTVGARVLNMRVNLPVRLNDHKKPARDYYTTRKLEWLYRDAERAVRPPEDRPRFYVQDEVRDALHEVFDSAVPDVDRLLTGKRGLDRRKAKAIAAYVKDRWPL